MSEHTEAPVITDYRAVPRGDCPVCGRRLALRWCPSPGPGINPSWTMRRHGTPICEGTGYSPEEIFHPAVANRGAADSRGCGTDENRQPRAVRRQGQPSQEHPVPEVRPEVSTHLVERNALLKQSLGIDGSPAPDA